MIPAYIEHGKRNMQVEQTRLQRRARDFDSLTVTRQHQDRDAYPEGATVDGYPNLRIIERESIEDGPLWQHRLQLEGLIEGTWREVDYAEDLPEEGWDTISLTIYTRSPGDARWRKGARVQGDDIEGVEGVASTSKLSSPEHGLITGQVAIVEFSAGFGGLTTLADYYIARINANQFYLAKSKANALTALVTPPAAAHAITGDGTTHKVAWTAHGLSDGDVVTFPALTGGLGLTAAVKPYYVVNKTTNDFQVSETSGGSVVAFSTNISAGTCQPGSAIKLGSDGDSMIVHPVLPGFESCYIVDRRKRKARAKGYYELDLQLKGIKQGEDDSKPVKRRINTTAQTVSNDKFPAIIASGVYLGFPPEIVGITTFGPPTIPGTVPAEFDLPQISVTDTFISTEPPPTWLIPGHWIPADAPPINIISVSSDASTYHFPSGWKALNIQSEQIPGRQLWLITITWGYQLATSPRTAPDP